MKEPKIVVGLTTWKKRIKTAYKTIESILNQTRPADCVELNVDYENFPNGIMDIPTEIVALANKFSNFKIYWSYKDYKVWLKSVPSIRRHVGEDYLLFTLDDDCIYNEDYIEKSLANFDRSKYQYMNTSTQGIAGEYMLYDGNFLDKCRPYLTNDFIEKVKVDDCCMLHFANKFGAKLAPRVPEDICKDQLLGYSYRREFSKELPPGVNDVSHWTKNDGTYPMSILQQELTIITRQLNKSPGELLRG